MIYHLKFSLTGGASCSEDGSPAAFAPGFCSSGFCSSAAIVVPFSRIVYFSLPLFARKCQIFLVLGQAVQQCLDRPADNIVHQPEVRGEDEDSHKNNDRGRLHLGARGGDHLAHLAAYVLKELAETCWLRLELLQSGAGLFGYRYCLGHSAASIFVVLL